jgi:hypothetical protein
VRCSGTLFRGRCCGRWGAERRSGCLCVGLEIAGSGGAGVPIKGPPADRMRGRTAGSGLAPPGVLLSLPHRLALLRERACTFLQVLGANDLLDSVQAVVQLERLVFRHHLRVSE